MFSLFPSSLILLLLTASKSFTLSLVPVAEQIFVDVVRLLSPDSDSDEAFAVSLVSSTLPLSNERKAERTTPTIEERPFSTTIAEEVKKRYNQHISERRRRRRRGMNERLFVDRQRWSLKIFVLVSVVSIILLGLIFLVIDRQRRRTSSSSSSLPAVIWERVFLRHFGLSARKRAAMQWLVLFCFVLFWLMSLFVQRRRDEQRFAWRRKRDVHSSLSDRFASLQRRTEEIQRKNSTSHKSDLQRQTDRERDREEVHL